jgi:putative DNA primase/helicase
VRNAEDLLRADQPSSAYILTSTGAVKPILSNAITAFAPLDLAFDCFQQRVVLREPSPWSSVGPWTDDDDLHGTEYLQRQDIFVENLRTTNGAARRVALKNQFHPVRDFLDSRVWDGKKGSITGLPATFARQRIPFIAISAACGSSPRWRASMNRVARRTA